jgi:hypothetical protein
MGAGAKVGKGWMDGWISSEGGGLSLAWIANENTGAPALGGGCMCSEAGPFVAWTTARMGTQQHQAFGGGGVTGGRAGGRRVCSKGGAFVARAAAQVRTQQHQPLGGGVAKGGGDMCSKGGTFCGMGGSADEHTAAPAGGGSYVQQGRLICGISCSANENTAAPAREEWDGEGEEQQQALVVHALR